MAVVFIDGLVAAKNLTLKSKKQVAVSAKRWRRYGHIW